MHRILSAPPISNDNSSWLSVTNYILCMHDYTNEELYNHHIHDKQQLHKQTNKNDSQTHLVRSDGV